MWVRFSYTALIVKFNLNYDKNFSYRRYPGTPKLDDRINDYPEFIGDKILAKIVSAYFEDVVDYLKHCSFDPEINIAIVIGR